MRGSIPVGVKLLALAYGLLPALLLSLTFFVLFILGRPDPFLAAIEVLIVATLSVPFLATAIGFLEGYPWSWWAGLWLAALAAVPAAWTAIALWRDEGWARAASDAWPRGVAVLAAIAGAVYLLRPTTRAWFQGASHQRL